MDHVSAMRIILPASLAASIGLLFLGCGPNQKEVLDSVMHSWIGQHRDALVRAWGPPIKETPVATGGSLLIYHSAGKESDAPEGNTFRDMLQRCRTEVETDIYGKIVRWRHLVQ